MLRRTLHGKLSLSLLGLLCLIGFLSVPLTLRTTQRYQQEVAQNINRPIAASLAAHLSAKNLLSQDPHVLLKVKKEIHYLMVINPNIDVYLLDARGNVLTASDAHGKVKRSQVALSPLQGFLSNEDPLPILGDDPRAASGRRIFSVAPFPVASGNRVPASPEGYVYVILGGERYNSVSGLLERSYILQSGIWTLVVVLIFVSVVGLLLFRLLTRRLRHLTSAMETLRDRGYSDAAQAELSSRLFTPWPGTTAPIDEIDRLGTVYLQMSDRIRKQIQELAQADTYRREMVSNVSHDLRTPLAALQGYLETLLIKEGHLTPEEQRNYVQTALQHSERLAKLVGELFELARLDSREVQLHPEAFSLSELVQDVVQQHLLSAQQKGVRLEAVLSDNLPFVTADIAMIERVLANLLDNALRYTPQGGAVIVSLTPREGAIEVRVTDTGSGIRQEDLPHIFERFYRVPNQADKLGCAGLGLAIAKRILELHGSAITVDSALDKGTSFIFPLPVQDARLTEPDPAKNGARL